MRRTSFAEVQHWPTTTADDDRESLRRDVKREIDEEMQERIDALQKEFDRKQQEALAEMSLLRQRNDLLEKRIEEEKEHEDGDDGYGSPALDRAQASPLGSSPVGSPGSGSPAQMSPLSSLSGSPDRSVRKKRLSVAHEALMMGAPEIGVNVRGDAGTSSNRRQSLGGNHAGLQRMWWKEQRDLLLQDLNPYGTSANAPAPSRPGGSRAYRKTTTASPGELSMTATRSETTRTSKPVVAEEEDEKPMGRANTCCNLSTHLERIPGGGSPATQGDTKLKKPATYSWSGRNGKH
jgi:hypothetical protein